MSAALDPFMDEDLDAAMEDDEGREHFVVSGDRVASWALRKMWKAEREIARLKRNHQDTLDALNEQVDAALKGPESDRSFFEGLLGQYHRTLIDKGEADKTYRLPAGELHARKSPDRVEVVDEAALRDFAEGSDRLDLIRIKVEPDRSALMKVMKETGEVIPGVEVRQGEVRFSAKPADIGLVES